jgi:UPF0755 protein
MNPSELPPVDVDRPMKLGDGKPFWTRKWFVVGAVAVFLFAMLIVYVFSSLRPVDTTNTTNVRFVVASGETAAEIAQSLYQAELIRDPFVFQLYTQLTGTKSQLQAGGYVLQRSLSVSDIVEHISSGKADDVVVTILPGLTLGHLADPEVEGSLAWQGYSAEEIADAFAADYQGGLFAGRPAGASLEGYIFPETHQTTASSSLKSVLQLSFDEFYTQIQQKGIEAKLQQQGLSLRDGIILASIVQKEVSNVDDQKQVAQVFIKRLKEGIVLGSDVTFMYIAEKEGREPSVNDDSLYNTRKHGGLPPGPISNFNLSALEAVANPAPGDYLYFVAGDDGTTHFGRTEAEHNDNVAKYCTVLCQ